MLQWIREIMFTIKSMFVLNFYSPTIFKSSITTFHVQHKSYMNREVLQNCKISIPQAQLRLLIEWPIFSSLIHTDSVWFLGHAFRVYEHIQRVGQRHVLTSCCSIHAKLRVSRYKYWFIAILVEYIKRLIVKS
jgi:hypothetical protein